MSKEVSFEKSMEKLENIVGEMEGGELSLDAMIKRFEEGQGLIKFCSGKLDEVERKIEKLLNNEGEPETEPFGDEKAESEKLQTAIEDMESATKTPRKEPPVDTAQADLPF